MQKTTRSIQGSTAITPTSDDVRELQSLAREALQRLSDDVMLDVSISITSRQDARALLPVALIRRYLETLEVPGRELLVFDSDEEVSSEVAAHMLGMSRPHLNELLDLEAIPYRRVGNQRRIRVADLGEYSNRRSEQKAALVAMAAINNESDDGWDS